MSDTLKNDGSTSSRVERLVTGVGKLAGRAADGVNIFRGVPYAEAPAGELRFAPPVARAPWSGVLEAGSDRAIAPQTESRLYHALGATEGEIGEDCLNLTIWAPANCNNAPVMFWMHGGAFMTGSGTLGWYDGERLAREHGVVVVTCNYRLGAAGYMNIPGRINGNFGVMDQVAGLRWVHDHIADFGGDAANVTVFGESAGGHAIGTMLLTPETEGLFRRAIMQSPPLGIPPEAPHAAEKRARAFVEALGLSFDDPDLVASLRRVSVKEMLEAQIAAAKVLQKMDYADVTPPFIPSDAAPSFLDGQEFVARIAAEAARRDIDVMIGWTRDEGALFMSGTPLQKRITEEVLISLYVNAFGAAGEDRLRAARLRRANATLEDLLDELVTDWTFRLDSIRFANEMAADGGRVFVYRFDWQSPDPSLRACHCVDLPFTFGAFKGFRSAPMMKGVNEDALRPIADAMMSYWASFARAGDPGFARWRNDQPSALVINEAIVEQKIDDLELF